MAQDQKQEAIINAAIKRFAHFGVAKTTMSEIAADLALSKASLYYYFPDKLSLYAEVIKTISEQGTAEAEAYLNRESDPFAAIRYFLEWRTDYIVRYHNVLAYMRMFPPSNIPGNLEPLIINLKKRELQRIVLILEKGIESKRFNINDPKKTAELFYDFLEGFRQSIFFSQPNFFPEKKQFQAALKRELEFATIFFKGLTVR